MSVSVFFAVLLAACLHAIWNALVKGGIDQHATMLAVVLGHVPIACLLLPFAQPIAPGALPWIIGSVALHLGYQLFLIAGYKAGDLTLVYPIARGAAPILVTLVSILVLGTTFTQTELLGTFLITLGLFSLAFVRRQDTNRNKRAVVMALVTGAFIAAYSLVDGTGAREAQTALGYWTWAALGNAAAFALWTAVKQPQAFHQILAYKATLRSGIIGGTASFVAYGLVIWAFTQAPIALVAALRETSIVFALIIGVGVLKERLDLVKVVSIFMTVLGAIILRANRP
jgi:drug/metabolite transporter (DMT)-like permease